MLTLKEINKARAMYYEQNLSVVYIARILKASRNTVYKYLKQINFSTDIKVKKPSRSKVEPYRDIIISWIEEDRLHHSKQKHTGKRVWERLKKEFPEFNCSEATTTTYFSQLKKDINASRCGYLPLSHFAGECQVDLGDCSFIENGVKMSGKYLVMTFPYSNASFCQLLHNKNVESILLAMKTILEYLNGVPHTMWFDNDAALVTLEHKDKIKRIINASFNRFKLHYDFKAVFTNPNKGYEKGAVEAGVRYMRKNLLVPLPSFDDFNEYNRKLLDRCKKLLNREHYVTKEPIIDLFFEDSNALNPLSPTPFDPCTVVATKLDNFGRLKTSSNIFYYLSPELAYKKVQVKYLPDHIEIYSAEGTFIMKVKRIIGTSGTRYINWSPYIRLLAYKPAAIYNFSFLDLFTDQEVIAKITKMSRTKLHAFLLRFADYIDEHGVDKAVADVRELL